MTDVLDHKWVTVGQVMDSFGVSDETVYRWLRSGKLKGFRIGRDWRIDARALEEVVNRDWGEQVDE